MNVWVKWVSWNPKNSTSNSLGQLNWLNSIVQIDKNVIWKLFIENKRAHKTISPNPLIIIHISKCFNSLTDTSTRIPDECVLTQWWMIFITKCYIQCNVKWRGFFYSKLTILSISLPLTNMFSGSWCWFYLFQRLKKSVRNFHVKFAMRW